jgi:hypothetical protein
MNIGGNGARRKISKEIFRTKLDANCRLTFKVDRPIESGAA